MSYADLGLLKHAIEEVALTDEGERNPLVLWVLLELHHLLTVQDKNMQSIMKKLGVPPPKDLSAVLDGSTIRLTWTNPQHQSVVGVNVYWTVNDPNFNDNAALYVFKSGAPGSPDGYDIVGAGGPNTFRVGIRTVDIAENESPVVGPVMVEVP